MYVLFRLSVKELLETDFFLNMNVRVELVKPLEDNIGDDITVIPFRLKVDDQKRAAKYKQDEAVEFDYTIGEDDPNSVAQEMVNIPAHFQPICSFSLLRNIVVWSFEICQGRARTVCMKI